MLESNQFRPLPGNDFGQDGYTLAMKRILYGIGFLFLAGYLAGPWFLEQMGKFLVVESAPVRQSDAVVVLSTGVDYLPRLMQAADLHRKGTAKLVVINGNRKSEAHRKLEKQGYVSPYPWHMRTVSILEFLGVDTRRVIAVDAQDVYDTFSEARLVGDDLRHRQVQKVIITTSKFHTRRALAIWRHLHGDTLEIQVVAARDDPFDVSGWWRDGRQIRQLMAEYGAWLFFWGKQLWD